MMSLGSKVMALLPLVAATAIASPVLAQTDPLPSWAESTSKAAIVDFVARVTGEGSPDLVPEAERIAVFDNDGTLWAEQPNYVQLAFALDRIRALAPEHPEWASTEPYASVLKGDDAAALAGGEKALMQIIADSHSGMTTEEFAKVVHDWITTTPNPVTGRLNTQMIYQPMLELLDYLRANGFETYIVSGGGVEFIRVFADATYGVPPENTVGTVGKLKYAVIDGQPVLLKEPGIAFVDDGPGKPVAISTHIGRRPIAAFGNSDGDLQMLEYTCLQQTPRLCAFVHHTDAEREWAYDRDSHIGKLDKGLDAAATFNWTLIDMAQDWTTVFPQ